MEGSKIQRRVKERVMNSPLNFWICKEGERWILDSIQCRLNTDEMVMLMEQRVEVEWVQVNILCFIHETLRTRRINYVMHFSWAPEALCLMQTKCFIYSCYLFKRENRMRIFEDERWCWRKICYGVESDVNEWMAYFIIRHQMVVLKCLRFYEDFSIQSSEMSWRSFEFLYLINCNFNL